MSSLENYIIFKISISNVLRNIEFFIICYYFKDVIDNKNRNFYLKFIEKFWNKKNNIKNFIYLIRFIVIKDFWILG